MPAPQNPQLAECAGCTGCAECGRSARNTLLVDDHLEKFERVPHGNGVLGPLAVRHKAAPLCSARIARSAAVLAVPPFHGEPGDEILAPGGELCRTLARLASAPHVGAAVIRPSPPPPPPPTSPQPDESALRTRAGAGPRRFKLVARHSSQPPTRRRREQESRAVGRPRTAGDSTEPERED
eukprot:SAG11_NODE_38_length_21705_cov_24.667453_2_plen_181_part_00